MAPTSFENVELPVNPNLPPWILSPKEEKLVMDRWLKASQAKCDEFIRKYIECTNRSGNPMDGMKNCKVENEKAQGCMNQFKTMKYLDEQKDIYIKEKLEKKKFIEDYIKKRDASK